MRKSTFALRVRPSLLAELRKAAADNAAINQFVNTAVAEILFALRTEEYFCERAARGDIQRAINICSDLQSKTARTAISGFSGRD
jgi:hypothetical protein